MKKVSIIVTSYNNSHNLEHCIESLINQNYDKNIVDLEIIFVDNGSTDGTVQLLDISSGSPDIIRSRRFWALLDRSPCLAYPPTSFRGTSPRVLNFQWLD